MLQAGRNITMAGDPLQKVKVEYLYNAIKNPKPDVANRIKQLRIVKNIDTKQYAILKKQLQRMLDSKRLSKIDEIDLLKAQMSEIQQKIKKLEGGK